jgi:hypothetical protein
MDIPIACKQGSKYRANLAEKMLKENNLPEYPRPTYLECPDFLKKSKIQSNA